MAVEYLNNAVLEKLVADFREAKKNENKEEIARLQIELTTAFYILAKNIIRAFKFQLIDKDDALQEGVILCFEKLNRFDPSRGKIFNYLSTLLINSSRQLYRTCKNYNELKIRYHKHLCDKTEEVYINDLQSKKGHYKRLGKEEE